MRLRSFFGRIFRFLSRVGQAASGPSERLSFAVCVNNAKLFHEVLLSSPCLRPGHGHQLMSFVNCRSAAEGYNEASHLARHPWLVYVHQDVFLPPGWDAQFLAGIREAERLFPRLAVVGVYGIGQNHLGQTHRLGEVYDRDRWLKEAHPLPAQAQSLDELCFAVRRDSGLVMDPGLGFDFYATDLVLQASALGLEAAVVHASCRHQSGLPREGLSEAFLTRFERSARHFAKKWHQRLPVTTPCIHLSGTRPVEDEIAAALAGAKGAEI